MAKPHPSSPPVSPPLPLISYSTAAGYRAEPEPESTRGSKAMSAGLIIILLAVSAGINFGSGSFALLLIFAGVLAGANVIAAGIRMADGPAAPSSVVPVVLGGARALATFLRRNLAFMGLLMISSAFAAVAGETGMAFCFGLFVLMLLGLSLINIAVLGA